MKMESRVAVLEEKMKAVESDIPSMKSKLAEHDVACEVNAPKAQSAHDGMVHMGNMLSIMQEQIKALQLRNDKTDKRDEQFTNDVITKLDTINTNISSLDIAVSSLNTWVNVIKLIAGFIILTLIPLLTWIVLAIFDGKAHVNHKIPPATHDSHKVKVKNKYGKKDNE